MNEVRYFDYNATTEVAPEVIEVMVDALRDGWGNPSSGHRWAAAARVFVERAKTRVADLIGAEPDEIVFTSGGTEADDLAVCGTPRGLVVSSPIEHPAISCRTGRADGPPPRRRRRRAGRRSGAAAGGHRPRHGDAREQRDRRPAAGRRARGPRVGRHRRPHRCRPGRGEDPGRTSGPSASIS